MNDVNLIIRHFSIVTNCHKTVLQLNQEEKESAENIPRATFETGGLSRDVIDNTLFDLFNDHELGEHEEEEEGAGVIEEEEVVIEE